MHGGMVQIFVRSYQDSNGDGIGDLRGLISRLDYLHDLGVSGLWLMPVCSSQDHDHGYAVTDYRGIEAAYGKLADLDALLVAAHARGMGVILDYLINHSASQHPAFAHAARDPASPYRDWYVFEPERPSGWQIYGANPWHPSATGWYFGAFSSRMPDFNLRNPAVLAWHHDNLRFWLNRGVDGFRLDAVGHLVENGADAWNNQPENSAILKGFQDVLAAYPSRYMVCEGPDDPLRYADTEAGGSAFAFGHNAQLIAAAQGSTQALAEVARFYATAPARMALMLSNHDAFAGQRLADQVHGCEVTQKLASALYLLAPGIPFVYYGEEIGLRGAERPGDAGLRTPMAWAGGPGGGFTLGKPYRALGANAHTHHVAAQESDPGSLLNHYRALLRLRKARPSLARGAFACSSVQGGVLAFVRTHGAEQTLVVINIGPATAVVLGGLGGPSWTPLLGAASTVQPKPNDQASVWAPARSFCVFGRAEASKRAF